MKDVKSALVCQVSPRPLNVGDVFKRDDQACLIRLARPALFQILMVLSLILATGSQSRATDRHVGPGQTYATIQAAANVVQPGDQVLIHTGTYRETVTLPTSGTAGSPITFMPYGTDVVTISGADTISGWTLDSGNIYYAIVNLPLGDWTQVFANGVAQSEARWPNATGYPWPSWSYSDSGGYDANGLNGWIIDSSLPTRPDDYWNGCTLQIMSGEGWIMNCPTVIDYVASTKKLVTNHTHTNGAYDVTTNNEFYITGKKEEMDSAGEWFYESSGTRLSIYSNGTPSNIEAKVRQYGFDLSGRSNIQLVNLNLFACSIKTDLNSTSCVFDGLNIKYVNHHRKATLTSGLILYGDHTILRNSELAYDSTGILDIQGNDIQIVNNWMHDSGYTPYFAAMVRGEGDRILISHNTLHDAGRSVMGSPGKASIVEYNNMYNGMRLTTDGAIVYTVSEAGNSIVRYNLIHDADPPTNHGGHGVDALYLDSRCSNWIVHHNIMWNVPGAAIKVNHPHAYVMAFNNTGWNTASSGLNFSGTAVPDSGSCMFNNLFPGGIVGTPGLDLRFNLFSDASLVDPGNADFRLQATSPARNTGTLIPGITDDFEEAAPDMGALEYNGTDWTANCGHNFANPPSPFPTYEFPDMSVPNKVKDGSFETGVLSPNWTTAVGSNVSVLDSNSWTDERLHIGYKGLAIGQGTSEIMQTVTGLLPDRPYRFYVWSKVENPASVVTLGVRNHGSSTMEVMASNADWDVQAVSFVTGPSSTSAEIYVHVVVPDSSFVYVEDTGMVLRYAENLPMPMPIFHLSFDESTGLVAHDATTSGLDATLQANMTDDDWVAGKIHNALDFDGSGDVVTVPMSGLSTPTDSFTVAFWVRFDTTGSGSPSLMNSASWGKKGWRIITNQERYIAMYLWDSDVNPNSFNMWPTITGTPPTPGQWYHLAWSIDRQEGKIYGYLDGVRTKTATIPVNFGSAATTNDILVGSSTFDGQLDDVRYYDCALTDAQIQALYTTDSQTALWLQLDDGAGADMAWDASGNGMNGVLTSMEPQTDWVPGLLEGALDFDGSGDYVNVPVSGVSTPTGSFTIAFWVRFDTTGSGSPSLMCNTTWQKKGWRIIANADRYMGMYLWDNDVNPNSVSMWPTITGSPPATDEWYHLAWSIDREAGKIYGYLNGIQTKTTTIPSYFGNVDTINDVQVGSSTFNGQLDDVRYYHRPLSLKEVASLASTRPTPY